MNAIMYRSSRNIEWMKSKFKVIKANLAEASAQLHAQTHQGQCDPFVSLRLVPEPKFAFTPRFKSRAQRRTLFPLIDETFDL